MTSSILKVFPVCYITEPNDFINYLSRKELTMPRLSIDAQLAKIKKQKAALEKKEEELKNKAENKDLIKIVALIKKAGLSAQDIAKAMKGNRGHKKATKSKLAGKKIPPKYRNPANKSQTWTGRGRAPAWVAELYEQGKLEKALIK
jgi:DNA-binding protein H-NS